MAPVDPQTAYLVFAAVLGGLILIISLFCGGNSKSEYTILFYQNVNKNKRGRNINHRVKTTAVPKLV